MAQTASYYYYKSQSSDTSLKSLLHILLMEDENSNLQNNTSKRKSTIGKGENNIRSISFKEAWKTLDISIILSTISLAEWTFSETFLLNEA